MCRLHTNMTNVLHRNPPHSIHCQSVIWSYLVYLVMLMECGLVTVSVSVSPPQYSALILTSFSPPPVSAMCTHVITGHNILPLSPSPSTNVYGGDNVSNISSGPSPAASPRPDSGSVVIIVRASLIYEGFLLLLYSLTTVQDLEISLIICTKQEGQCYFLEITDISWYFSLQQEENICVRAFTITMFHVLSAHTLPRAAAGLLAAALYLLCPGVPAPATGQAGGLGLYGATPTRFRTKESWANT